MKKIRFHGTKRFALIQLMLILSWLTYLRKTDAYFFVSCLMACGGIFCVCENNRNPQPLVRKESFRILLLAAVFSLSGILANYSLFEPFGTLTNLFGLICSFLGGLSIGANVIVYLLRSFPVDGAAEGTGAQPGKVFACSFISIVCIDLLFLFLVEWPGVLTADSLNQVGQIVSGSYNNAHPFWHTATIGLFVKLGRLFSMDLHVGIGLFSVFQIVFMAGCFSYVVMTLYQKRIPRWCVAAVWTVYALMPYNISYSVTVWKDILFSGASLLMITALYRLILPVGEKQKLDWVLFTLGSTGLCLWRTNGLLAFSMLFLAMIPTAAKNRKLLAVMAGVLAVCLVLCGPVLSMMNIEGSDFVEALSIPQQQIARVVKDGLPMEEEDLALIRTVAEPEDIAQAYSPILSDPIKALVRRSPGYSLIQENPAEYLKLWVRLGLQHPGAYLKAWVDQTKGYWNGGYSYWVSTSGISENSLGLVSHSENLFSRIYYKIQRYLELIPMVHPLISIGIHTWTMVICCFICHRKGRKEWLLALPALMIVVGLMIGTPVYAEFRYGYPVLLACPLMLSITAFGGRETK